MSARGLFVTGTDTDAGKTVVSTALLHALRARGQRAIGMKPVASGCRWSEAGWRNDDALALQAASEPVCDYALVNPYALPEATAPQIAAARAGVTLELAPMLAAYRQLAERADTVLVEGVGGWLAPLSESIDQGDLVAALQLQVILVVDLRLGCINHARLSERAIRSDGHTLVGWIGNSTQAHLDFADAYFEALSANLSTPCLGRLPHAPGTSPNVFAKQLPMAF